MIFIGDLGSFQQVFKLSGASSHSARRVSTILGVALQMNYRSLTVEVSIARHKEPSFNQRFAYRTPKGDIDTDRALASY